MRIRESVKILACCLLLNEYWSIAAMERNVLMEYPAHAPWKQGQTNVIIGQIGTWGRWSLWSPCSRPCGGGVASQHRECVMRAVPVNRFDISLDSKRSKCVGLYKRFKICNPQKCEKPVDFRAKQCSHFNTRRYKRKFYTWAPYIDRLDSCSLNCRAEGEQFYATLKKMVLDGTECKVKNGRNYESGVCVEGTCMVSGCDGFLGSNKKFDDCGVCGGDSDCNKISGVFNLPKFSRGYHLVNTVPPGSENISVFHLNAMDNFLALRVQGSGFVLNGPHGYNETKTLMAAFGNSFSYTRSTEVEKIISKGPTKNFVDILVYATDAASDIQYRYRVSSNRSTQVQNRDTLNDDAFQIEKPGDVEKQFFEQIEGRRGKKIWNENSDEKMNINSEDEGGKMNIGNGESGRINTGNKDSEVKLNKENKGEKDENKQKVWKGKGNWKEDVKNDDKKKFEDGKKDWNEELSSKREKTYSVQEIIGRKYGWEKYEKEEREKEYNMNKNIEVGNKVRKDKNSVENVNDMKEDIKENRQSGERKGHKRIVDDYKVKVKKKRLKHLKEKRRKKKYRWIISGFTECTHTCGGGTQETVSSCVRRRNTKEMLPHHFCSVIPMLRIQVLKCNLRPCPPEWFPESWSTCSVSCGVGIQTRKLKCGQKVSQDLLIDLKLEKCENLSKLSRARTCEFPDCDSKPIWKWSAWSNCSTACGVGIRTRKVHCESFGRKVEMKMCEEPKPREQEMCDMGSCATNTWFFSSWGTCPCQTGVQRRKVHCPGNKPDGPSPKMSCDTSLKPKETRECLPEKCSVGSWFEGPWSACSSNCGTGTQNRIILCVLWQKGKFRIVKDQFCEGKKPEFARRCEATCVSAWFTSEWSKCSENCGAGIQRREIKCLDHNLNTSMHCSIQSKPDARKPCDIRQCESSPVKLNDKSVYDIFGAKASVNFLSEMEDTKTIEKKFGNKKDSRKIPVAAAVRDACEDTMQNCDLVLKSRLCRLKYYTKVCCRTCFV